MKERPILFSAPMVRAILDGRKTQTRRVIKPQPDFAARPCWSYGDGTRGPGWYCSEMDYPEEGSVFYSCPYGQPGDRFWVRETWALSGEAADAVLSEFNNPKLTLKRHLKWRADKDGYDDSVQAWRPSIHMPRWASRTTLEVTGVRVERLKDICGNISDAEAEGCEARKDASPAKVFSELWDTLAKPGATWADNPWVIEFNRVQP